MYTNIFDTLSMDTDDTDTVGTRFLDSISIESNEINFLAQIWSQWLKRINKVYKNNGFFLNRFDYFDKINLML